MSKVRAYREKQTKSYQRLDETISRMFSASHMSNAKWVKLLKAVASFEERSYPITYKLVSCEQVRQSRTEPYEEHIDNFWFCEPAFYKEIEWLEFTFDECNELNRLIEALFKIADFPITKAVTGYRVIGYS